MLVCVLDNKNVNSFLYNNRKTEQFLDNTYIFIVFITFSLNNYRHVSNLYIFVHSQLATHNQLVLLSATNSFERSRKM